MYSVNGEIVDVHRARDSFDRRDGFFRSVLMHQEIADREIAREHPCASGPERMLSSRVNACCLCMEDQSFDNGALVRF
jgi:hypothetical protein